MSSELVPSLLNLNLNLNLNLSRISLNPLLKSGFLMLLLVNLAPTALAQTSVSKSGDVASKQYGASMPDAGQVVSLQQAITRYQAGEKKAQKISGKVNEVCRKKGCWMILSDNNHHARVTFKDYSFFVPVDTANQDSIVYGVLVEQTLSEQQAKHYAKDAGNSLASAKARREYSIVAEAVTIANK